MTVLVTDARSDRPLVLDYNSDLVDVLLLKRAATGTMVGSTWDNQIDTNPRTFMRSYNVIENTRSFETQMYDVVITPKQAGAQNLTLNFTAGGESVSKTIALSVTMDSTDIADKTALRAAIAEAEKITIEHRYSAVSWGALQTALLVARVTESNANATQQSVDAATEMLARAIEAMERTCSAGIRGPDGMNLSGGRAEYVIWLDAYEERVNVIEIRFTINDNLDYMNADIELLDAFEKLGFEVMDLDWLEVLDAGGKLLEVKGRITLAIYGNQFVSIEGLNDIIKLSMNALRFGSGTVVETVEITLTDVVLAAHPEDDHPELIYLHIADEDANRKAFVYSRYDLNRDGVVNVLDLSIALLAIGWTENDVGWNDYRLTIDRHGQPITPAMVNVNSTPNENGVQTINMTDIIDFMRNYTEW